MYRHLRQLCCAAVLALPTPAFADLPTWHVSPTGDDSNTGSITSPLRTIAAAQSAVRQYLESTTSPKPVSVWLHAGEYSVTECWTLGPKDSGTPDAPVLWSAIDGEKVVITGGHPLGTFTKVPLDLLIHIPEAARPHVTGWEISSELLGNDATTWPQHCFAKIYAGDQALTPARSPNCDWAIGTWIDGSQFQCETVDFPKHDIESAWLHGFFSDHWADQFLTLRDHSGDLVEPDFIPDNPLAEARFRTIHAPENLDLLGEWYFDKKNQLLIAWLPENTRPAITQADTLLAIYAAHDIRIEGLIFQQAEHMAIEVARGKNIVVNNCRVNGICDTGIHVFGGTNNTVSACTIEHVGRHAIRVEAGDRTTLVSCEHKIENCWISDFGRAKIGFSSAIYLAGVGSTVRNCRIADGSDAAIRMDGNDHLIELNDIHNVCQDTSDTGAIYLGHDWTERGSTIRHNYLSDIGRRGNIDVMGIYLDDFASGTLIEANIIRNAGRAIAVGGGRDNQINGNVIVDCTMSIQVDARGQSWAADQVQGVNSPLHICLKELGNSQSLYFERYPNLHSCTTPLASHADGNKIENNVLIGSGSISLESNISRSEVTLANNRKHPGSSLRDTSWWPSTLASDSTVQAVIGEVVAWLHIGPQMTASKLISIHSPSDKN